MISIILLGRTVPGFTSLVDRVSAELRAPVRTEMMDFPLTRSFRGRRGQYDGDMLLRELSGHRSKGGITLFLLREDMFAGGQEFAFGLAGSGICIISTARLDPRFYGTPPDMQSARALFLERLLKEAIRGIGRSVGLPDCEVKGCAMGPSDTVADVDLKGAALCGGCKKVIKTYLG